MVTSNAGRFLEGQTTDERALALRMFWGTVITAFRNKTLLWNTIGPGGVGGTDTLSGVVSSKVVTEGKSFPFPIIGDDPVPEYHRPGVELLGQVIELDEGTITIDDILVSHKDIPLDQTMISHFDVVQPFARALGRSLATDFDKKLFIVGITAARRAAVANIHNGGNVVERVNGAGVSGAYPVTAAGANNFRDDVAQLGQLMDEDGIPEEGRFLMITPFIRRVLGQEEKIFDRDFSDMLATMTNDLNRRLIGMLEGFMVMKPTNHLPTTVITSKFAKYAGDFTFDGAGEGEPVALALTGAEEGKAAIGYVSNGGVMAHMMFDHRRNTTFMKAQMLVGADVLSPWAAGEIRVDDA